MKLIITIERPVLEGRVMRIEKTIDLNRLRRSINPWRVLWREVMELESILAGKRKPKP